MAARGEAMSIMNLLLKPLWSRSWQMAPTNIDKHLRREERKLSLNICALKFSIKGAGKVMQSAVPIRL